MKTYHNLGIIVAAVAALVIVVFAFSVNTQKPDSLLISSTTALVPFTSSEDFLTYLQKADQQSGLAYNNTISTFSGELDFASAETTSGVAEVMALGDTTSNAKASIERVSETNVQVANIDEPDIVKTDGSNIYISGDDNSYYLDPAFFRKYTEDYITPEVRSYVVGALPVDTMTLHSSIDTNGDLLLYEDTLMVFQYSTITGYNISNPTQPQQTWRFELGNETGYETARLIDDQLYIIARSYVNYDQPCPLQPLTSGEEPLIIDCASIYHPADVLPTDSTYTVMKVNPTSGDISTSTSFVGSYDSSVVYMSEDNLYVTHTKPANSYELTLEFIAQADDAIMSQAVKDRLTEVDSYDISLQSKFSEMQIAVAEHFESIEDDDERADTETDFQDAFQRYTNERKRELETTTITQLELTSLAITATGTVPGRPLNQFSLDEHNKHLRIATTIGDSNNFWYWLPEIDSVNDLYVLNSDLAVTGSVQDLGAGERIYSTRFVGDIGYMVTFKETDPFYVFNLANPAQPQKTGELKIPGYSSYLHPLTDTTVLGVGIEEGKVKLSLFDVSDVENPTEISKLLLDAYWTDVNSNHHAFLQDAKHSVVFLPADSDGYVVGYENNTLSLVKKINDLYASRALYINDNLYVVGSSQVKAFNETNWEKVGEMTYR